MAHEDKDSMCQKSGVFTSTNLHMLTVQNNTYGIQAGLLVTDSRNTITHPPAQLVYRTFSRFGMLHFNREGGTGGHQDHQQGHVHLSEWPCSQQKPGGKPSALPMGPGTTRHSFTAAQVIITVPSPTMGPPHSLHPISYTIWGHTKFFISTYGPLSPSSHPMIVSPTHCSTSKQP